MHASGADAFEVRFSESAPTIDSSPPLPARQLPRAVSAFATQQRAPGTGMGRTSPSRVNGFSETSRRGDERSYLNIMSFSRIGFVRFKAKELEVEYQQYVLKTDAAPHVRFLRFFWILFLIGAFFFLLRDFFEDPSPFELPLHLYFVNNWEWPVLLGLAVVMALFVLPFVPHPFSQWYKRPVKSKLLRKMEERSPHNVRPAVHCWFVLCLLAMGFVNVYPKFMTEEKGLWEHDSLNPQNYPDDDGGYSKACESSRACAEQSLDIYVEEVVRAQDNFFTFITVFFLCAVLHLFQPSYAWSLALCASQLLVFAPCLCTSIAIVDSSDFTGWVVFRLIFVILLLLLLLLGSHVHEVQRRQLFTLMYVTRKRNAALHDLNMRMTREARGNQTRSSRLPPALDLSSPLYKVVKTLHKMQADPLLGHWQVELQQLIDAILNNMQSLLRPNLPGVSKQMKGDSMMAQLMYELPKSHSLHRHAAARPRPAGQLHRRDRSWPSQCTASRCAGSMDRFSAPGNCYAGSAKHDAEGRGSTERAAASSLHASGTPARAQSNVLELTLPTTGACSSEVSSEEVDQTPTDREASPPFLHAISPILAHGGVVNGAKASPATAGSSADVLSGHSRVALPDSTSLRIFGVSAEVRPRSAFDQPDRWLPRVPRPMLQDGSAAARQIIRSAMTSWNGHPDPALLKEHGISFAEREGGGPFGVFALREIFGDCLLHLMLREAIYSLRLDRNLHCPLQMDALGSFADALTAHYMPVPYHNVVHVCDVLQSSFYLLWRQQQHADSQVLPPLAMLAFVVAAAVHDVAHPGVNNNFITTTISPLALVYNDQHPLENMHVSLGMQLLLLPANNFVAKLPQARFRQLREWIIESVLATDLSQHFESLERLNLKAAQGSLDFGSDGVEETEKKDDIVLFIKNALHAADIGSVGKSWPLYLAWMQRVFQEFFAQGDREKLLGVEPAPFMDRKVASIPKAQQGFINYICLPLFTSLSGLYPQFEFICHHMRENVQHLQGLEETDTESILAMPLPASLAVDHPSGTRLAAVGTNASSTTGET